MPLPMIPNIPHPVRGNGEQNQVISHPRCGASVVPDCGAAAPPADSRRHGDARPWRGCFAGRLTAEHSCHAMASPLRRRGFSGAFGSGHGVAASLNGPYRSIYANPWHQCPADRLSARQPRHTLTPLLRRQALSGPSTPRHGVAAPLGASRHARGAQGPGTCVGICYCLLLETEEARNPIA